MIGKILGRCLLAYQRQFVGTYVDLSGLPDRDRHGEDLAQYRASRGACLRSHSWRKTFALYVFRTDSRMIAAIAQQFHHLSLAMTEQGYLGSDPTLLEVMDSVRTQQTALFFYEMARGVRPVAGRMGRLIDEHRAELEGIIAGMDEREGLRALERWVVQQDLRIWFASHGKCFLRLAPGQARCHQLGGTTHWMNHEPNYAYRNPEVCLGCPVYAHRWRTRGLLGASLLGESDRLDESCRRAIRKGLSHLRISRPAKRRRITSDRCWATSGRHRDKR